MYIHMYIPKTIGRLGITFIGSVHRNGKSKIKIKLSGQWLRLLCWQEVAAFIPVVQSAAVAMNRAAPVMLVMIVMIVLILHDLRECRMIWIVLFDLWLIILNSRTFIFLNWDQLLNYILVINMYVVTNAKSTTLVQWALTVLQIFTLTVRTVSLSKATCCHC